MGINSLILILVVTVHLVVSDDVIQAAQKVYKERFHADVSSETLGAIKVAGPNDFENFIKSFGKVYSSAGVKAEKFRNFQINSVIAAFLQATEKGTAIYGVTKFSDLSQAEFSRSFSGTNPYRSARPKIPIVSQKNTLWNGAPTSIDWRTKGAVSPVKNQGECGSCWAFAAVENVEGQWFLKKGKLYSMSEQEVMDCDTTDYGCGGGSPQFAFDAIQGLGGLELETAYPYKAMQDKCTFNKSLVVAYINKSIELPTDEGDLASWCGLHGPVATSINDDPMQYYKGGIMNPTTCPRNQLNHGILLAGYGEDNGIPFWLVKNSWGADWGEQGYLKVARGNGTCGLNLYASSSIVL